MKFQKGNEYGKLGKRGKGKVTLEVKERLSDLDDVVFEKLKDGIEAGDFQYMKLWFNYRYGLPIRSVEVKDETDFSRYPVIIKFETTKEDEGYQD